MTDRAAEDVHSLTEQVATLFDRIAELETELSARSYRSPLCDRHIEQLKKMPAVCPFCRIAAENARADAAQEALAAHHALGRGEDLQRIAELEVTNTRLQERCDKQTVQAVDSTGAVSAVYARLAEAEALLVRVPRPVKMDLSRQWLLFNDIEAYLADRGK